MPLLCVLFDDTAVNQYEVNGNYPESEHCIADATRGTFVSQTTRSPPRSPSRILNICGKLHPCGEPWERWGPIRSLVEPKSELIRALKCQTFVAAGNFSPDLGARYLEFENLRQDTAYDFLLRPPTTASSGRFLCHEVPLSANIARLMPPWRHRRGAVASSTDEQGFWLGRRNERVEAETWAHGTGSCARSAAPCRPCAQKAQIRALKCRWVSLGVTWGVPRGALDIVAGQPPPHFFRGAGIAPGGSWTTRA